MRLRLTSLTRAVSTLLFRSSSPIGCPRRYYPLGRRVDRRRGYARHSKADTTVVQFAGSLGAAASTASLLGSSSPRWHALLLLPRAPPSRTRCLCPSCSRTHSPKHPERRSTTVCWPSLLSQIFLSNLLLHCVIVEMYNCEKFLKN